MPKITGKKEKREYWRIKQRQSRLYSTKKTKDCIDCGVLIYDMHIRCGKCHGDFLKNNYLSYDEK